MLLIAAWQWAESLPAGESWRSAGRAAGDHGIGGIAGASPAREREGEGGWTVVGVRIGAAGERERGLACPTTTIITH